MSEAGSSHSEIIRSGAFLKQLSNLSTDTLAEDFPADLSFHAAFQSWAEAHMPEDQATLFQRLFSNEALQEAFSQGQTSLTFDFDDQIGTPARRRLTLRLLTDPDGDLLCVCRIAEQPPEKPEEQKAAADSSADQTLFQAVIRPYRLFFNLDLNKPQIRADSLLRDLDHLGGEQTFPCTYPAFLKAIAGRYVRAAWAEEFLAAFSLDSLKQAKEQGRQVLRRSFSSESGALRMDVYLPEKGSESAVCSLGLCRAEEEGSAALMVSDQNGEAMHAALEDLQLEMQMEREETRKKHRRHTLVLVLLTVVIGIVGGAAMYRLIPEFSKVINLFLPEQKTEEAAETPPPVVSEDVEPPETVVTWTALTTETTFTAEIMENGTSRMSTSAKNYESLSFTASVAEVLNPEWFGKQYARNNYPLDGTEAAVHLRIRFDAGETLTSVIPQEAFEIRITDAAGNQIQGYQLMDQPMGGAYQVSVAADTETDLYKRFPYNEDARYLVLACYQDGVRHEIRFALRYDDPNVDYEALKQGDRGDFVLAMKQKLAELGYLSERAATNNQYNIETTNAVKAAQEAFGMEQTGIAEPAFLKRLYGGEAAAESAETDDSEQAEASDADAE